MRQRSGGNRPDQLDALFRQSDVGNPLVGVANGRLLYLTDKRLPKLKVRLANAVWRGKAAHEDVYFVNRWIGNVNWIDSTYVIGPSWVDGKPAIIMEYAPGTPVFANMHDELREVAPGLYMGPVYERFPCPKFRGYVALQLEPCCEGRSVPTSVSALQPHAGPGQVIELTKLPRYHSEVMHLTRRRGALTHLLDGKVLMPANQVTISER